MKLQGNLKYASTIPDAFDITNFVRRDRGVYYFDSFQFFEYDQYVTCGYKYSESVHVIKHCSSGIDPDKYDAFLELENFLHINLLADGTLDPLALSAHKARTMKNNYITITNLTHQNIKVSASSGGSGAGGSDKYSVEYEATKPETNGLYCNCVKPDLKFPKDKVEGKEFDYCKACKKERLEQKSNTGWATWSPNGIYF